MSSEFSFFLTFIANQISVEALKDVAQVLQQQSLIVNKERCLSESAPACIEFQVTSKNKIDSKDLKKKLFSIVSLTGADISIQSEDFYHREKKLMVFDLDSTLISCEVIDECARELGIDEEISSITQQAMEGKINFDESLILRASKLKGLRLDQMEKVYSRIELTSGAQELVFILKKIGLKVAIVSGGFTYFCDRIREKLGADFAFANSLEIVNGKVTGQMITPLVNAKRKKEILEKLASQERIELDQVVAVGDGANDLLMLEKSGLGIAFNAKPILREKADFVLNQKDLRTVLFLFGMSRREWDSMLT